MLLPCWVVHKSWKINHLELLPLIFSGGVLLYLEKENNTNFPASYPLVIKVV